jgi:hypothetical protein
MVYNVLMNEKESYRKGHHRFMLAARRAVQSASVGEIHRVPYEESSREESEAGEIPGAHKRASVGIVEGKPGDRSSREEKI